MVLLPAAEDGLRFLGSYTLMKSALAATRSASGVPVTVRSALLVDQGRRPLQVR